MNDALETKIEKLAGRRSDGSGYSFFDGTRDLNWQFARKSYAEKLVSKIKAAKLRGVKVELVEDE